MNSSKKVIKAGNVNIKPLRAGEGEDFIHSGWDVNEAPGLTSSGNSSARQGESGAVKAEKASREVYERGYREGLKDGENRVSGREASVLGMLGKVHGQCLELKGQLNVSIERDIVNLAFALAEKIINREVSLNPTIIIDSLGDILKDIKDKTELVIRVHPDDERTLREHTFIDLDKEDFLNFTADALLKRGDIIVETRGRIVDARIIQQIEILRESFPVSEVSGDL